MKTSCKTGLESGLLCCPHCRLISRLPVLPTANRQRKRLSIQCPRCHARLHPRIPHSLAKTTALVIAAACMYVPANILPIMNITYLGSGQTDTIMGGVIHLLAAGMWPLALIVFVASILVPMLKLLVMGGLLLSIRFKSRWRPAQRTHLFHITEFIGRWSMVDIFVLAILVALVQFGNIASVDAGLGALSFAAVVMLTMFAAHTFDPRLIWDAMHKTDTSCPTPEQATSIEPLPDHANRSPGHE